MPSLSTLDPDFRPYAEEFFRVAHSLFPRLVVTSARRSYFDQLRLWLNYQWAKSLAVGVGADLGPREDAAQRLAKILPAAPPGHSKHEQGLAWDMAQLNIEPFRDDVLPQLGSIWIRIGGIWRPSDPVHFEA
jgi:hypothetical protein